MQAQKIIIRQTNKVVESIDCNRMTKPMSNIAEHLPHDKSCGYGCSVVDATSCAHHENLPSLSSEGQWHGVTNNGGEGRFDA